MPIEKDQWQIIFCPKFCKGNYEAIRLFLGRIEWTRTLEGKDVYEMWNVFLYISRSSKSVHSHEEKADRQIFQAYLV